MLLELNTRSKLVIGIRQKNELLDIIKNYSILLKLYLLEFKFLWIRRGLIPEPEIASDPYMGNKWLLLLWGVEDWHGRDYTPLHKIIYNNLNALWSSQLLG